MNLHTHHDDLSDFSGKLLGNDENLLIYTAMRDEIIAGDMEGIREFIEKNLLSTPKDAQRLFQAVMFYFPDYDDDLREIFHIPECRSWFQRIDLEYPFLIYFIPCSQYTLYVGSQRFLDGGRLTLDDLKAFFLMRDRAIQAFVRQIEEPYPVIVEKLQRAFWKYAQLEIKW